MTVFPAGFENDPQTQAVDQTVLIRAQTTNLVTEKGRGSWAPDGYVAYSKLCTHAGCPVGLYERELRLLVCPCHQSMFNIDERRGPAVRAGPAPVAPAAARTYDSERLPAGPGAATISPSGPATGSGRRREPRRHRPPTASDRLGEPGPAAPTAASARSSTSSTTASASPRAAGPSSTRSSPTTGRSCWARSRCTPSSS